MASNLIIELIAEASTDEQIEGLIEILIEDTTVSEVEGLRHQLKEKYERENRLPSKANYRRAMDLLD